MINHILVPLDGSALAECVLPHVGAIAPVTHARVTLLHILQQPHNGRSTPAIDPVEWHLQKQNAEKYLQEIANRLNEAGILGAETVILEGNPASGVIEYARNNNVDLIALSTHGNSGISGWNVSSVVQKILLRSYKSTLLVRAYMTSVAETTKVHYKRLFVGIDGSARSEFVLPFAINLAKFHKAQLILETVVEKPRVVKRLPPSEELAELANQFVEKNLQAASHYFKQLLAQFSTKDLKIKTHLSIGDSAITVLHDMAEEANPDLVLLVAHGETGERRWPYGSMTTSFIAYGNSSLLIMQDLPVAEMHPTRAEMAVKEIKGHRSMQSSAPITQPEPVKQNTSIPNNDPDQAIVELARQLADCKPRRTSFSIPARLRQFLRFFQKCYEYFEETNKTQVSTSQTSEWLMDNFYVIEQAIRQVEQDLPADYYQRLPKTRQGWARIYVAARANTNPEDTRLEAEQVQHFLRVFQAITPLTTGELWALPLMLRLAVLEILAVALAAVTKLEWDVAPQPDPGIPVIEVAHADPDIIVANSILNLRLLATHDWKTFFESASALEEIPRRDPAHIYGQMDFEARNHYRNVIEELAHGSTMDEVAIARQAIQSAQEGASVREQHVGYYLIERGREALEAQISFRPRFSQALVRAIQRNATSFYLGAIGLLTFLMCSVIVLYAGRAGGTFVHLVTVAMLSWLPVSSLAIELVHSFVVSLIAPRTLPKLNFENGVPEEYRTMVVIPALLASERDAPFLLSQIERHFIGNSDPNLGNWLVDPAWNLILIDHSRAFTSDRKLTHEMGRIDRELWQRMQALDEETLTEVLGPWLGRREIRAVLPETYAPGDDDPGLVDPYCRVVEPFQTSIRGLASYLIPKIDVQISGTWSSDPGPQLSATYVATNAVVRPSLRRNLSENSSVTVNLIEPGTLYADRRTNLDFRVSKILRYGRTRTQVGVDIYNLTNTDVVTSYNQRFIPGGSWLAPTGIQPARYAKFNVQVDF